MTDDLLPVGTFKFGDGVVEALGQGAPVKESLVAHAQGDTGSAIRSEDEMLSQATAFGFGGDYHSRHRMPDGKVLLLQTPANREHTTSEILADG